MELPIIIVANDNDPPPTTTISLTDLATAMGIDEDVILERLAVILSKRVENQ